MIVDGSPMLPREREDRKRRKEHERQSTKRTGEVERETENQEEAARTSQKRTYFSLVLFLQCLESEPESCCGVAYTTYHVDLSSDDGGEHRLFWLILEVLLENRTCMLSFLQFLWTTRVRMPRATVVRIISVILFLRLVMWLHQETVPLGLGRVDVENPFGDLVSWTISPPNVSVNFPRLFRLW